MKVIMCAAGKGTRISRNIQDVPKSTLPINGVPLIRLNTEYYLSKGYEVVVVVGYNYHKIKDALDGLKVKYFYNPFYMVTNSLASLWMAKDEIDDECIIMNADVYYEPSILDMMLEAKKEVVMASDSSRIVDGDFFFGLSKEGFITKYGKGLPLEDRSGEYVGLAYISKTFIDTFRKQVDQLIWNGELNCWWENALYSLADKGYNIPAIDVSGYFWSEIDYFDDYMRIIDYTSKR